MLRRCAVFTSHAPVKHPGKFLRERQIILRKKALRSRRGLSLANDAPFHSRGGREALCRESLREREIAEERAVERFTHIGNTITVSQFQRVDTNSVIKQSVALFVERLRFAACSSSGERLQLTLAHLASRNRAPIVFPGGSDVRSVKIRSGWGPRVRSLILYPFISAHKSRRLLKGSCTDGSSVLRNQVAALRKQWSSKKWGSLVIFLMLFRHVNHGNKNAIPCSFNAPVRYAARSPGMCVLICATRSRVIIGEIAAGRGAHSARINTANVLVNSRE